jgi:hypothetical protein
VVRTLRPAQVQKLRLRSSKRLVAGLGPSRRSSGRRRWSDLCMDAYDAWRTSPSGDAGSDFVPARVIGLALVDEPANSVVDRSRSAGILLLNPRCDVKPTMGDEFGNQIRWSIRNPSRSTACCNFCCLVGTHRAGPMSHSHASSDRACCARRQVLWKDVCTWCAGRPKFQILARLAEPTWVFIGSRFSSAL